MLMGLKWVTSIIKIRSLLNIFILIVNLKLQFEKITKYKPKPNYYDLRMIAIAIGKTNYAEIILILKIIQIHNLTMVSE